MIEYKREDPMKEHPFPYFAALALTLLAASARAETLQGKIEFTAVSNVKMFKFNGASSTFESKVERTGNQLKSLELRVPVSSITTGMGVRDEHMKKRIFTAPDSTTPDIVFKADKSDCKPGASASEQNCLVQGKLTIRGQEQPFPLSVVLKDGKTVTGEATIDVLQFGVTPENLSWTTVKVNKDTKLNFEVTLQ